ncbi:4013_t:CDS:1, partial [Scutellospora calospora]
MSTNPTLKNISYLKTLELNILKNSSSDAIAKDIRVSELDLCSMYKEELFLYELKKLFTTLIYGHIYYYSCLENYIKNLLQCSKCAIEIKSIDYVHSGTSKQSTLDLIQISPQTVQIVSDQSQNI